LSGTRDKRGRRSEPGWPPRLPSHIQAFPKRLKSYVYGSKEWDLRSIRNSRSMIKSRRLTPDSSLPTRGGYGTVPRRPDPFRSDERSAKRFTEPWVW
jgi:hypothetical protein